MTTITTDGALEIIRLMVRKEGSQLEVAKKLDISQPYLTDILKGRRAISDAVARKLGYRRVTVFEKEGR